MEVCYNDEQPVLVSVTMNSENSALLDWNCDTTDILGYRVYSSVDGVSWDLVLDENNCTTTSAEVTVLSSINYFRISSVKNDSLGVAESNWSNILGASFFSSDKKAIIVDGFDRESGSWRGAGHPFALKYGSALEKLSLNFTSVKNSELQNGKFLADNYEYLFWIAGDESTVDETFNSSDQAIVESFLENGGDFFLSGSEVGWDLDYKGSEKIKHFIIII